METQINCSKDVGQVTAAVAEVDIGWYIIVYQSNVQYFAYVQNSKEQLDYC